METIFIKIYHGFNQGKRVFKDFLDNIGKVLISQKFSLGLHYKKWEFFYTVFWKPYTLKSFWNQFYTFFKDFQLTQQKKNIWDYDDKKSIIGEIYLENKDFYPFLMDSEDDTEFIFNIFRSFENFNVAHDRMGFILEIESINEQKTSFFLASKLRFFFFKFGLIKKVFAYMWNVKIKKWWKQKGDAFFRKKLETDLFRVKIFLIAQSDDIKSAEGNIRSIFLNFLSFRNYPLNEFKLKIHTHTNIEKVKRLQAPVKSFIMTSEEISQFFHFPQNPQNETSLLKVTAKKLAVPIGIPTSDYGKYRWEIIPKNIKPGTNIVGISDYRSIQIPIGVYDEDRLRHTYIIGKTGVGKSKFITSMIVQDIKQGHGIALIDPHGDLFEEVIAHIPESRKKDVIIFDPTDEDFPFCLNPLDVKTTESKQVLAKGFIDIFKKFFGANWNPKLEHVLRMIFLALLDKKDSTLFDIIRALTDKDFRYEMIEDINDDVVRNFWTNEFAGWSQQFNTEAIMPILNKVGQLLSIDILKNIFASSENKLDFRQAMDERKILLIKLPKGKLQEEIMGFLGAMFVTKLFQSAMGRQGLEKSKRTPFFLYVDEFQNFATETFNEILSEARKYGLGLMLAHQFIKQIPANISDALFGNVGTLISFRISSEDAGYIKQHFDPFLHGYDLSNLNQREFYCKMQVKGHIKDPLSARTLFLPDPVFDPRKIKELYEISRKKYNRTMIEAKKAIKQEQKDVVEKLDKFEDFWSPII